MRNVLRPGVFVLVLLFATTGKVFAQNNKGSTQRQANACGVTAVINPGQDSVITVSTIVLFTSASINASSYQFIIDRVAHPANNPVNYAIPTGITEVKLVAINGNCRDTAVCYYFYAGTYPPDTNNVKMYYGQPGINEYIRDFCKLSDGNFLIQNERYNNSFLNLAQRGQLIKTKPSGCLEWSLMFDSTNSFQTTTNLGHISPDSSGGFYVTGKTEGNSYFTMKMDAAGNKLWAKRIELYGGSSAFQPVAVRSMPDGGAIMTGELWNVKYLVIRFDAAGNIVWQKEYIKGNSVWANGLKNIFFKDGKLYIGGWLTYDGSQSLMILMKLDYATGQTVWTKRYVNAAGENIVIRDMHSVDTAILISAQSGPALGIWSVHSLLKIDTAGNVLNNTNFYHAEEFYTDYFSIIPISGKKYYLLTAGTHPLPLQPYVSFQTKIIKIDSNYNILWAKHHAGVNLGQYHYGIADADESLVMAGYETGQVHAYYSSLSSKVVIRKIDSSGIEPATSCALSAWPFNKNVTTVTNSVFTWTVDINSSYAATEVPVSFYRYYPEMRFKCPDYVDSCSFFKISGPGSVCNLSNQYVFKAHKNRACGQPVQWAIPPGVNLVSQTDTTITVTFSAFGNYMIKGFLSLGCVPTKDSILVKVNSTSPPLNLGIDTSLCPNNSLVLHAGTQFFAYQWQDNSTDSTFTVTSPGLYWVHVTDSCGNILRDSVTVSAATAVPISIGPDRTKCNNDTIRLQAPAGFMNYTWSPNYNITSTNTANTVVNPAVDTSYYIIAEKTPGCFAFDTVRITVRTSPPINLGPDKSICQGDSLIANAGAGFSQYQWSNGSTTQQVSLFTPNNYSVIGTAANGCRSYDTVRLVSVISLPIITLDPNPTLCIGDTRLLDAGPGYSSYIWNTGNTSQTISITGMGMYAVEVTDNFGCKGRDTTYITQVFSLPSAFLPADTAVCDYGSIDLRPLSTFNQYVWSTGSSSPVITITQPAQYWLQVRDQNGCVGRDTVIVNPKDCLLGFYMPTAFTPNNDGKNDVLRPMLFGKVNLYQFWIYNRWGQVVFQTSDLKKGWNGTYMGALQDGNVFTWMCRYQFEGQPVETRKGTTVLIR